MVVNNVLLLLRQETQYAYSLRASSPFGNLRTGDVFPYRNNRMLSQAIHLGDIVKSRRARGDAKVGGLSRLRRSLARSRATRFARPIGELARRLVPLGLLPLASDSSHELPPPPPRNVVPKEVSYPIQPPNTLLARNSAGEGSPKLLLRIKLRP